MAGDPEIDNERLLLAVRHQLRRRILALMADGKLRSPTEIAAELGESLSSVSYHVRTLAECRCLIEVERRRVRGATQHFYRRSVQCGWIDALLADEADEGK